MSEQRHADIPEWEVNIGDDGRVSFAHASQARAYLRGKFKGQCIVAQFYPHRVKRSQRQNDGFHAMISPWAKQEGHEMVDLKADLLGHVFGYIETVSLITGEARETLAEPSTSRLTVGQFCELIERTLDIAAEAGVILVAPDEYRRQREAKAKRETKLAAKEQQGYGWEV